MNAPCEDEVEVVNRDENVGVFPPNATTKGQNDRKRKGNVDGPHVECQKCSALYTSHSKRNGMENMKARLENSSDKHPHHCTFCSGEKGANKEDLNLESGEEVVEYPDSSDSYPDSSESSPSSGVFNANTARMLIAKMIIINKLPLNFVKDEGFRRFMERTVCAFAPEFVIPSLATVARDILEIYQSEKAHLRNFMVNHNCTVSLTVNTWTSDQGMNYMVLTGHFIDIGWRIQRKILNFRQIENFRGETIGREVEKCLKQWGIKNILTLAVDNASSNDSAIAYLVNRFKNGLVLDGNFVHVRCCAHILNLIVFDVMEDFQELISKVRNVVKFVRSSPTRYRCFEKCMEEENLSSKSVVCLDVPTRWDNTYMMLESAEKFEKVFERLRIHDTAYLNEDIPSSRDWEVIRTLVQFLSLFYKANLRLSGSLCVLSNTVFHEICTIQNYIKKCSSNSENLVLNDIAMRIQAKSDKYWGNSENANYLLYVAVVVVLDPRYKMKFLLYCFSELFEVNVAKEMCKKVEDFLRQLFNEFRLCIRDYDSHAPRMGHHSNTVKCSTNDATFDDEAFHFKDMFGKVMEEDKNVDAATEVDIYLLEPLVKFKEFDLLHYWNVNSVRFRVLSEIVREILAIPISTIASESAFNISGRVIDSMCLTLAPNLVEVLACLQNWLSEDAVSIDLREHMKDIISMEEDLETSLKDASIMGKRTTVLRGKKE